MEEINNIKNAGLSVFPIYQDGGYYEEYFANDSQGTIDAQIAISAAKKVGIPSGSVIYFAVDFDAYEYQINSMIMPYFKNISLIFNSSENSKGYRVGIYGPRLVCTKVSNAGYDAFSFVADMSTGFSGNLGYPIPNNWSFDQFYEYSFPSNPSFDLDKDAYSGRDIGIVKFDKVEPKTPEEIEEENQHNKINISRMQFVYDVLEPLKMLEKITSVGFAYNEEIIIDQISSSNMSIQTSMEAITELVTPSNDSYNITIELNNDGSLSSQFESKVLRITKDERFEFAGEEIGKSIINIASSIKSGNMAFSVSYPTPSQIELSLEVISDDLLPTIDGADSYVTVVIKNLITIYDSKVTETVITEEGIVIGLTVLAIAAIIIFAPEAIPLIPGWLSRLGYIGG